MYEILAILFLRLHKSPRRSDFGVTPTFFRLEVNNLQILQIVDLGHFIIMIMTKIGPLSAVHAIYTGGMFVSIGSKLRVFTGPVNRRSDLSILGTATFVLLEK